MFKERVRFLDPAEDFNFIEKDEGFRTHRLNNKTGWDVLPIYQQTVHF